MDERAKRAILLAFRVLPMVRVAGRRLPLPRPGAADSPTSTASAWSPGAIVRWGAYVAPGAVLMPSFVNIGAYVDSGTMVDTWATVGSCAQIGKNVHLSGGVGIGGVLEPPNAVPVVIEDDAFIGSRCMVVEGARVRTGAVLGAGHDPHRQSTHVIDVRDRRGAAARRGAGLVGLRRRHPGPPVPRRRVRHAVRAGAQAAARGRASRQGSLNDILRDHGVSS